uniref:Uncharacterized protein n=1 Tax=Tetranychus urticae TaxID=32264 RepID=T1KDK4_TETUR
MIHTPSPASSSLSLDVYQYWHNVIKERDSSSKIVIEYTLKIFNTLRSQLYKTQIPSFLSPRRFKTLANGRE